MGIELVLASKLAVCLIMCGLPQCFRTGYFAHKRACARLIVQPQAALEPLLALAWCCWIVTGKLKFWDQAYFLVECACDLRVRRCGFIEEISQTHTTSTPSEGVSGIT